MTSLCLALGICSFAAFGSWAVETPSHRRVQLTDGLLFIPAGFKPTPQGEFDLTWHLHGAPGVVERQFLAAQRPGVLANTSLPGLSGVYARRFKDTNAFWRLLRETEAQFRTSNTSAPRVRHVTVTCFSAGFGGVREWLKDTAIAARLDALVMADSIYAGFAGDAAARRVNPADMAGFLAFAREAALGRKQLLVTHSPLHTPAYASTAETANHLIAELGGARETAREEWAGGLRLLSRFCTGRCEILGFDGDTAEDHLRHLRHLGAFLERIGFERAPVRPIGGTPRIPRVRGAGGR
ncbi:MAG: hypothetical protein JXQ71_04870 [Verrucomicrobia bacterium]|nr:hypothetical protein [Verrucomicrobiota bacterium]